MKILYILDNPDAFKGGCWFYRNFMPGQALIKKGHKVKSMVLGQGVPKELLEYPDVAVFSRYYPYDPLITMRAFKKAGKRVVYEADDDFWNINPDNPSVEMSEEKRRQYEHLMREVDAITTTTEYLAKMLRKFNKNVFVCPNSVDYSRFKKRPGKNKVLRVGYSGAASHWTDLNMITDVIIDLQKKHDFEFVIQGMTGCPIECEMFMYDKIFTMGMQPEKNKYFKSALDWFKKMRNVNFFHIPFYPPELFPAMLNRANFDIGIAPLMDNKFNKSKSCVKFYEYAAVGTVTLASDVRPYKQEVGYCAKNTKKDWYKKLEKLIVDKKFREKLLVKQQKWVKENRDLHKIVVRWEDSLDVL